MAREIERKFLVCSDAWREQVDSRSHFRQAYLTDHRSGRASVRVRLLDDRGELNIKSLELGISREEFQYDIPGDEARQMLDHLCTGPEIEKTRHWVRAGGHLWEIDEFEGDNAGLIVAEVELESEAERIDPPDWLGPEVTHLPRYFNVALVQRPFREWTAFEQAAKDAD